MCGRREIVKRTGCPHIQVCPLPSCEGRLGRGLSRRRRSSRSPPPALPAGGHKGGECRLCLLQRSRFFSATATKISPLLSYWKPPRGLLKAGYPWALRVEHDATDEAMGEQGDRCGNDRGSAAMVRRGVRATVRQRRAGELFRQYLHRLV